MLGISLAVLTIGFPKFTVIPDGSMVEFLWMRYPIMIAFY